MIAELEKVGTKEAFGTIARDGIADFLTGDKSDTFEGSLFAKKEDEIWSMPCFGGTLVDRIKLT